MRARRASRAAARAGQALALALVFVLGVALAALLHLDAPAARRWVERTVAARLERARGAPIALRGLEHLSVRGARVADVQASLGEGAVRVQARDVEVTVHLWAMLKGAVRGGALTIDVAALRAGEAHVTFARASPAAGAGGPPARLPRIFVRAIAIERASFSGEISGEVPIVAYAAPIRGAVALDERAFEAHARAGFAAAAPLPWPLSGALDASCTLPVGPGAPPRSAEITLALRAGEAHGHLVLAVRGDRVEGFAAVPRISGDELSELVPRLAPRAEVEGFATLEGTLPVVHLRAHAAAGRATADAALRARVEAPRTLDGEVVLAHVDLRALGTGAPASDLGVRAAVALREEGAGRRTASMSGSTLPGRVGATRLPAIAFDARIDGGETTVHARARSHGIGARASVRYARGRVHGSLAVDARELVVGPATLTGGAVAATIEGAPRSPRVEVDARAASIVAGKLRFERVALRSAGRAKSATVTASSRGGTFDRLDASAKVRLGPRVVARDVVLAASRREARLDATASAVGVGREGVDVRDLVVRGLGDEIDAQLEISPARVRASIAAPEVDLALVHAWIGGTTFPAAGHARADVALDVVRGRPEGRAELTVSGLALGELRGFTGTGAIELDGARLRGSARLGARGIGSATFDADGALGRPSLDAPALEGAMGHATLSTDRLELDRVCRALRCPPALDSVPLQVSARVDLVRGEHRPSGDTRVTVAGEAWDDQGPLVGVGAETDLHLLPLLRTGRFPSEAPLRADLGIARRRVDQLAGERARDLRGTVTAYGHAEGSLARPFIVFEVSANGLRSRAQAAPPLDGNWITTYDLTSLASELRLSRRGKDALHLTVGASASLDELLQTPGRAPWRGDLELARFPLATAEPLLAGIVERLRGTVDGRFHAAGALSGEGPRLRIEGQASVAHGGAFIPLIGREISGASARVVADGTGAIRLDSVTTQLGAGRVVGNAVLHLDGIVVRDATAEIDVPRGASVPLTLEGVSYGEGWGHALVNARSDDHVTRVTVQLPTFRVELPPRRTRAVESLAPNPAVRVLQPLGPPEPTRQTSGRKYEIALDLGDDVGIRQREMSLELSGRPVIILGEGRTRAEGFVRILGGRFPVLGKTFVVERGIVKFGGSDPTDPSLEVDAVYETPDGVHVNAHVGGTLRDGKLTLHSDPPRSESELLALIVFGQPVAPGEGAAGVGPGGPGGAGAPGTAGSPGAGALTAGLNQLLGASELPIEARVATTPAATRASAAVELGERVRVEYTRQFGAQIYGQQRDVNIFSLDWRFRPRWVLRTEVGDRGTTSIDVLFQKWY